MSPTEAPISSIKRFIFEVHKWYSSSLLGRVIGVALTVTFACGLADQTVASQTQGRSENQADKPPAGNYPRAAPAQIVATAQERIAANKGITANTEENRQWYSKPDWWVAGFTGALFLSTTGLWVITWLLWNVTRRSVNDASAAVANSGRQADAAEATLHVLERPYLLIDVKRSQILPPNSRTKDSLPVAEFAFSAVLVNCGRVPAVVENGLWQVCVLDELPREPDYASIPTAIPRSLLPPIGANGASVILEQTSQYHRLDGRSRGLIYTGRYSFFIYGRISYISADGTRRVYGFCLRHNAYKNAIEQAGGSAYNYDILC